MLWPWSLPPPQCHSTQSKSGVKQSRLPSRTRPHTHAVTQLPGGIYGATVVYPTPGHRSDAKRPCLCLPSTPVLCPLLVIHDLRTLLCLELNAQFMTPPSLNLFLMYFHFFSRQGLMSHSLTFDSVIILLPQPPHCEMTGVSPVTGWNPKIILKRPCEPGRGHKCKKPINREKKGKNWAWGWEKLGARATERPVVWRPLDLRTGGTGWREGTVEGGVCKGPRARPHGSPQVTTTPRPAGQQTKSKIRAPRPLLGPGLHLRLDGFLKFL